MLIHCVDLYIGSTFQKRKQWNLFYQNFFVKLTVEPFILWYALFVCVSWSGCWMFSVFWVWSIFPCIFWVWSRFSCINKSILSVHLCQVPPLNLQTFQVSFFQVIFLFPELPPPPPKFLKIWMEAQLNSPSRKGVGGAQYGIYLNICLWSWPRYFSPLYNS